ncbi:MAG: helix-turn-helix transcriptional regulator [Chloroflexi bacterium]|nr:helix-turn-helix transcriptional regulator [Chloroflexota bacterium]
MYKRELLKGSTETLLLSLLAREPMYGYRLVKDMNRLSGGYFRFKEGTLYPALHRLEKEGLVDGRWQPARSGQQRRYYFITGQGQRALEARQNEWRRFSRAVDRVIRMETV